MRELVVRYFRSLAVFLCGLAFGCPSATASLVGTPPSSVKTWRVFELALSADVPGTNPYVNGPSVTATFTGTGGAATGRTLVMKGFWDGGNIWRIRFAPTAPGDWSYTTASGDPGLSGIAGMVTAIEATPEEIAGSALYRGFLQRDGYAWKLSDGSLFLPVGDTHWSFSEEFTTSEWQTWMSARAAQKFNTFQGCVWLAIYNRSGVPEAFPGKDPQTDNLQVAYFQRLDQMVQYANDRGIMMGLTIGGFPDNSNWWGKFGTLARNDRWFRYCVARYTAYNVRWILYGEVNERNPPGGWGGGITTWQAQVAHDAQLVKDEDPYDHPLGSHHNRVDTSSAGSTNIDYVEVQIDTCGARTETQYNAALSYRSYGKPVWFEEYWYENTSCDNEYVQGIRNTHRNFVAAMAFPTIGTLMRNHFTDNPPPNAAAAATDPGAIRMSHFYDWFKGLDMRRFTPSGSLVSRGQCGRFGSGYAIFLQGGGSVDLNLAGVSGSFNVRSLDINTGAITTLSGVTGGAQRTIASGTTGDVSILVTPAGPVQNQAPNVDAGPDQAIRGTRQTALDGTVTDDGLPDPPAAVTIQWTKVSGPGIVAFGHADAADTSVTFSMAGRYVLRLTAGDGALEASDETTVTVRVPGDFDGDADVDQEDFGDFQLCLTAPGVPQENGPCAPARLDLDDDVDGNDFNLFSGCMSGANVTGNAACTG